MVEIVIPVEDGNTPREVSDLLGQALASIKVERLTLSPTCAHMLVESIKAMKLKRAEQDVLSTSTVFLTTLVAAMSIASRVGYTEEIGQGGELARFHEWGETVLSEYRTEIEQFCSEFFIQVPSPNVDNIDVFDIALPSGIVCGPGFSRCLSGYSEGRTVTITSLILTLLADPQTGISQALRQRNLANLERALVTMSPDARIGQLEFVRQAARDELALDFENYGRALASIFRGAKGEFTFGLFGRWGSGKTTLAGVLANILEAQDEDARSVRYKVVVHNAWKYKAPPEAWVYLYRSLAESANKSFGFGGRIALAIRTSILRSGPWNIVGGLLMIGFAAMPLGAKLDLLRVLASLIGASLLIYIAVLAMSVSRRVSALFSKHTRLTSHDEKLGMLALVGDDLRALLVGWTGPHVEKQELVDSPTSIFTSGFSTRRILTFLSSKTANAWNALGIPWHRISASMVVLLLAGALWAIGLMHPTVWEMSEPTEKTFFSYVAEGLPWKKNDENRFDVEKIYKLLTLNISAFSNATADIETVGEITWRHWVTWAIWFVGSILIMLAPFLFRLRQPDRILLVIDDLDRCSPTEMLDVIENTRLLIDDPAINERMQILYLVDEVALEHSIAFKYKTMIDERSAVSVRSTHSQKAKAAARQEVVREQNEKIFGCYLRVNQLNRSDVGAIIEGLVDRQFRRNFLDRAKEDRLKFDRSIAAGVMTPSSRPADYLFEEEYSNPSAYESNGQSRQQDTRPSVVPLLQGSSGFAYTPDEITELKSLIPEYFDRIQRKPSPRSIRLLLFRIRLCRLLLRMKYPNASNKQTSTKAILDAFHEAMAPLEQTSNSDAVIAIARQVV